jgi:hypothetical protein
MLLTVRVGNHKLSDRLMWATDVVFFSATINTRKNICTEIFCPQCILPQTEPRFAQ